MPKRWKLATLAAGAAFLGASCTEEGGFTEPRKVREQIIDLNMQIIDGQNGVEVHGVVPGDVTHPHFEGNWTFRDPEIPTDVYVFRAADFQDGVPPPDQADNAYWTSVQDALVGSQRSTSMHLHPTPGDWLIVFYNPATYGPTTRSTINANVELNYFR